MSDRILDKALRSLIYPESGIYSETAETQRFAALVTFGKTSAQ
jgi:hypothetical protein